MSTPATAHTTEQKPSEHKPEGEVKMQYKRLGKTGLKLSRIGLGCMGFGTPGFWMANKIIEKDEAIPLIKKAWEAGINFFNTAHFYSDGVSEEILGEAIKTLKIPRDEIIITTKVYIGSSKKTLPGDDDTKVKNSIGVNGSGLSRKNLFASIDAALKRLQTDYIDVYIIARWDSATPIEETMKALHDLVQMGKCRYIGASTMYAWQFAKAQRVAEKNGWTKFVSMENLYNLVYREEEREMNPQCLDMGVGLTPWSPLAHGFLAKPEPPKELGPRTGWYNDGSYKVLEVVSRLAKEKKVSNAQICIAWLLSKEAVTAPIIGVTSEHHLMDAIAALNVTLTKEEIAELEKPYTPLPIQGWHQ